MYILTPYFSFLGFGAWSACFAFLRCFALVALLLPPAQI